MKSLLALLSVFALLAANAAIAGPLAPAPRVIAKYDRNFLERSGAQTLEELLDTGIVRDFITGGQSLLVLIDGTPYATTSGELDGLPISAIERIELLSGESLGTLGGGAVRGALDVVLRNDLDGAETRAVARMPSREGGDGWQGSAFWGGAVGKGRMTVGADILKRQEITSRSRDYSRSAWRQGGAFDEAQNVSVGGNTVWVVQLDDDGDLTGIRSVALGACDPARGYTSPLSDPPGPPTPAGDKGCGFAYGAIMWETARYDQRSAVLKLDHPLGEDAELHAYARVVQSDWAYRFAPSVGSFALTLDPVRNADLLRAINEAAGSDFVADGNDFFSVAHRFVGFGNRDWRADSEEYDLTLGVEGRLTTDLGYDARITAFRSDSALTGDTFVHGPTIREEIQAGNYDLANPFSEAPEHVQAKRNASLREEIDAGGDSWGARLALEGSGFAIGGRDAAWTAGAEAASVDVHHLMVFRGRDQTYPVSQVLGSGGVSYSGDRRTVGAFAEMALPLAETVDLRIAGRADEYDDVGMLNSWRLAAEYRPIDPITLRSSWGAGDRAPSMSNLYSTEDQDHPYIDCDPGGGPPPRTCPESNSRQVTRSTTGNPDLDPSSSERLAIGVEARRGPFFLGVEWYRLSTSGGAGHNSADWSMQNLPECMGGEKADCIERTGGDVTIHDRYANVVDSELTGITARFGGGFRTSWGVVGMRGAWRHVLDTELRIAGEEDRLAIAKNMVRVGFLARRGGLSAIWTANYRSGYENRAGTGEFDSWTGHDLVLDWAGPLGLEGARLTAGVFNLTDAGLSVDTSNPSSVDGPTEAGWGRTFFLTLNMRF